MARIVFGMNVSLDLYVDHDAFAPDPELFRHFIAQARDLTGSIYGRRLYELMRYWDEDDPSWTPDRRDFAQAWRSQRKWVASGSLSAVGPNATRLEGDIEAAIRAIKTRLSGEIRIGGPDLASRLAGTGLIDAYQLYVHPVALGHGTPFFARARVPLRLLACERMGEDIVRLTYAPA